MINIHLKNGTIVPVSSDSKYDKPSIIKDHETGIIKVTFDNKFCTTLDNFLYWVEVDDAPQQT